MIDLKGFRWDNSLTQADVAAFLGVSKPFISRIESGKDLLPEDKLSMLRNNEKGWNIAKLEDSKGEVYIAAGVTKNKQADNNSWAQKKIAMLEERIKQLEAEKAEYWELIKKLTAK